MKSTKLIGLLGFWSAAPMNKLILNSLHSRERPPLNSLHSRERPPASAAATTPRPVRRLWHFGSRLIKSCHLASGCHTLMMKGFVAASSPKTTFLPKNTASHILSGFFMICKQTMETHWFHGFTWLYYVLLSFSPFPMISRLPLWWSSWAFGEPGKHCFWYSPRSSCAELGESEVTHLKIPKTKKRVQTLLNFRLPVVASFDKYIRISENWCHSIRPKTIKIVLDSIEAALDSESFETTQLRWPLQISHNHCSLLLSLVIFVFFIILH